MRQRNSGQDEVNILQNRFTAYLIKAIRRQKKDYMAKKNRLLAHEIYGTFQEKNLPDRNTPELPEQLPVLMCLENMALLEAIKDLNELERGILFARVLEQYSYDELAQKLGLRYKGASAAYYRVIQKLRQKMRGEK